MFFTEKKLKNSMKRNKITAWLTIVVMLAAILSLPVAASAAGGGDIVMIAAGGNFSLLLKSDGTVWAWGDNSNGQLGDGTYVDRHTPTPVRGLEGKEITAIAAGMNFSAALDSEGKVWAWGDNGYKQLGLSTATGRSNVPVEISALAGKIVTAITAGYNHIVALDSDAGLWAWGNNENGQLGLGYTHGEHSTYVEVPKLVPLDTLGGRTVVSIAAGFVNTAVIANDGTLWTCGSVFVLGRDNSPVSDNLLGQVTGFDAAGIEEAAIGRYHMAARDEDGKVWSWGSATNGQLGESITEYYRQTPAQVQSMNDKSITAIAAGGDNTVVLVDTGTVWTCGSNTSGQLGNGTQNSDTNYFTESSTLVGFSEISVAKTYDFNNVHMLGLKSDGTLWAWGYNADGQLGNGSTTNSSVPVRVAGMVTLTAAAALIEDGLDGAQLTVNVSLDTFKNDVTASQFVLNNAPEGLTVTNAVYSPAGLSVTDAVYSNGATVALFLSFDGDFDSDIDNLNVTIAADALNGWQELITNNIRLMAIDEPYVTPDQELNERNLDGRTLTVELQTGRFADPTLDPGSFTLNNAPPGLSIAGVNCTGETQCNIVLASDGSDFDNDITDCSISIAGSELRDGKQQTTDKFSITAVPESATVTANQSLVESSLNGSLLSVILLNDTFRDNSLDKANFILNNAPAGLSVGSVFYNDSTHCVVTLSYDGTYFANDINDFGLTIKAVEMSSKGDVSGNSLTITAQPQELSISTGSLPAATVDTAYSETVQAAGGTGAYTWSAVGLPSGLSLNTETGEISGTPDTAGNNQVIFTVEDEGGNSASKTINLQVNLTAGIGKYNISPVFDSSYTKSTATDGIAAMTVNSGVTGFKYFTVDVTPAETHNGDEVVIFVHLRNGAQLSINATSADFDSINRAKAGFNVQTGDVVKAYVVDNLTNAEDSNPTLLQ